MLCYRLSALNVIDVLDINKTFEWRKKISKIEIYIEIENDGISFSNWFLFGASVHVSYHDSKKYHRGIEKEGSVQWADVIKSIIWVESSNVPVNLCSVHKLK